jgi:phosphinothricin acetyltransferase
MAETLIAIRVVTASDADAIAAIYGPIVTGTAISFEVEPPTAEEMERRITSTLQTHPWLIAEQNGKLIGYAYAGPHRARPAYRWSVDVTAYVDASTRRSGVGRALYAELLNILRAQGFRTAFAGIALPNEASIGLHEAMGFKCLGIYEDVGFKNGRWRDVGWWQLRLSNSTGDPAEPIPFAILER